MSAEMLFIHVLWASVALVALYVTNKCVEKYTTAKSLEAVALVSERICFAIFQMLKEGKRVGNFPVVIDGTGQKRSNGSNPASAQTEEKHSPPTNTLFDLRD